MCFVFRWFVLSVFVATSLSGASFRISAELPLARGPNIVARAVWTGESFVVAWSEGGRILLRRVTTEATFVEPAAVEAMAIDGAPAVGFDGDTLLLVATRWSAETGYTWYARRFTRDLQPIDPEPRMITSGAITELIYDGVGYVVVVLRRSAERELWVARLDRAGSVIAERRIPANAPADPAIAFNGVEFLLAWNDTPPIICDVPQGCVVPEYIHAVTFNRELDLTSLRGEAIAGGYSPGVAWSRSFFFVVWSDFRSVRGARIFFPFTGRTRGSAVLMPPSQSDLVGRTSVTWDGSHFVVAAANTTGVRVARVDADGKPVDDVSGKYVYRGLGWFSSPRIFPGPPGISLLQYSGGGVLAVRIIQSDVRAGRLRAARARS